MFTDILCHYFGHKADKHILAYSIESHHMFYEVKIYDIARCSRCGEIYHNDLIDQYERYAWYTQSAAEQEEKKLREQHIVQVSEAYTLLKEEKPT